VLRLNEFYCCCLFHYRLNPETFGYNLVRFNLQRHYKQMIYLEVRGAARGSQWLSHGETTRL